VLSSDKKKITIQTTAETAKGTNIEVKLAGFKNPRSMEPT
jgi:hypothetical protein